MNSEEAVRKPRALVVPFGYPDYPRELLERFKNESVKALTDWGLDVDSTEIVILYEDSQKARKKLAESEYDFIIVLVLSWLEAPNVTATLNDYFHTPMLLWSHTMFRERGELLTLGPIPGVGVIRETFEQMGVRFKFVYGMPDSKKVQEETEIFSKATFATSRLSKAKIGLLGYASMGMYTGTAGHLAVRKKLGPEIDHLGQYVLIKKAESVQEERVEELIAKAKEEWDITDDVTEGDLKTVMKMYVALKDLAKEFGWSALTVKCQYELSRYYGATPCVPLSMLADEMPCSCEGDIPLIITQLMMHYLKGGETTTYCDLHNITETSLLLGACGFAPFGMALGKPKVTKHTAIFEGLSNSTVYKEGKVTIGRLSANIDGSFKMQIETGDSNIPEPFHEVGCVQYPSMEVTPDGCTDYFGQHMMSQHYSIIYGDIKRELMELCRLLNIRVFSSKTD